MERKQTDKMVRSDDMADVAPRFRAVAAVSIALLVVAGATAVWRRECLRDAQQEVPTVTVSVGRHGNGERLLGYPSVVNGPAHSSSRTRLLQLTKSESIWATWLELRTSSGEICKVSPALKDGSLILEVETEFPVRFHISGHLTPTDKATDKVVKPGEESLEMQLPKSDG